MHNLDFSIVKIVATSWSVRIRLFNSVAKRKWSNEKEVKTANQKLLIYDMVDYNKYMCLECDQHDAYRWLGAAAQGTAFISLSNR